MIQKKLSIIGISDNYNRWLLSLFLMTLLIVMVGGITRVTHSGLSIVEWKVVMDILPPLTAQDWQHLFQQYQLTEQYQQTFGEFSLADFKKIFWWEYIHRLLARLLGFNLAIGIIILLIKKIPAPPFQKIGLVTLFFLGGSQAYVGKWMVASGLFTSTSVGAINLVVHFFMALIILFLLFAMMAKHEGQKLNYKKSTLLITLTLLATMLLGSLTAGSKAGYSYGTWPLMGDSFIPKDYWWQGGNGDIITDHDADDAIFTQELNFWDNATINPSAIQFHHRIFAYVSFFLIFFYMLAHRRNNTPQKKIAQILFLLLTLQIFIGILLVVKVIPPPLALLHQWVGVASLVVAFHLWFTKQKI